jgi:ABC-type amino acid transport substrate-binding protein
VIAGEQFDVARIERMFGDSVVGQGVHSKEPIAIVTRTDDRQFSDFVNWVLQSIMAAEELRNNGGNIAELPTHTYFGEGLEFMFHDAVAVVSDYGALYTRHLEQFYPRPDANRINVNTGAMFALPFGNLSPKALPNVSGGTLSAIRDRGFLKCGINDAAVFAEFDTTQNEWIGLDVDFCKALSAAIFDGAVHVRYSLLGPTERFLSLQNGEVDVLSRATTYTLERDVQEPTTGSGFSFSPANFFDSIHFSGVPEFVACADRRDYESDFCRDLVTCVTDGTTQHRVLVTLLPEQNIRVSSETSATLEAFVDGRCNTIFGEWL